MAQEIELLIVSSRIENKRALLQILNGFPVTVFVAGSIEQAEDVLLHHRISIILCDEHIADGTYHHVLALSIDRIPKIQCVVLCTGGPRESQEALQLGATEVVRFPLQSTDIELALIHAMRRLSAAARAA